MVSDSHQMDADGKVHAHITPAKTYWVIFGALIFFTLLTVAVSYVHLGPMNLVVAIAIATVKGALVVLYFMHLKYETKFNVLVFLSALLFMGVFLAYTMNDTQHRGEVDVVNGGRIDPRTGEWAYGTPEGLVAQHEAEQERRREALEGVGPAAAGSEEAPAPESEAPAEEAGAEEEADAPGGSSETAAAGSESGDGDDEQGAAAGESAGGDGEGSQDGEDTAEAQQGGGEASAESSADSE